MAEVGRRSALELLQDDVDAFMADLGDGSGLTLLSITGALGDPAVDTFAEVIGQLLDAALAMDTASDGTQTQIMLLRAILERIGETTDDPDDAIHTILGQRDIPALGKNADDTGAESAIALLRSLIDRAGNVGTSDIYSGVQNDLAGKMQTKVKTLDLNTAVVGLNDLFTGAGQTVIIEKLIIKMPDAPGAAPMTGITIQTDHTTAQVFITAAQGAVANMTAQNQFSSTDPISLEVGKKVQLTLAGGQSLAGYVVTIEVLYRAVTTGGNLT